MKGTLTVKVTEEQGSPVFVIDSRMQDVDGFGIALLINSLASAFLEPAGKKKLFFLLSTGVLDRIDRTEISMEVPG